jgi:hypothetical protein
MEPLYREEGKYNRVGVKMEGVLPAPSHKRVRTSTYILYKDIRIFLSDLLHTHSVI